MAIETSSSVKSAIRTLDILELIARQRQPMAAHEIATALSIPVSSLAYLLSTLAERGYVNRIGRHYGPGEALARLSPSTASLSLADQVAPLVRSLRVQLNETASFFVRREHEIEALVTETGQQALRYALEVGQRAPLHSFSAGKAILARLSQEELEDYFDHAQRTAFTPQTITDAEALQRELIAIRKSGFAWTREEHTPGIVGIGRAATIGDTVLGAFSVAIPIARFDREVERKAIEALRKAADLLATSAETPPAS